MGSARTLRSPAARHVAAWLLTAAVAALIAGLGLGWLVLDDGASDGLRMTDDARAPTGAAAGPAPPRGPPVGGAPGSGSSATAAAPAVPPSPAPTPTPSPAGSPSPGAATVASAEPRDSVTVVVDGTRRRVAAAGATVGELLERLGVELGPHDRVRPGRGEAVAAGDRVVVERARVRQRQREVPIAHGHRERPASALAPGQRRTVRQGRAGLVVISEEVVTVAGEVVATRELDREVARPPREAIIEVGAAQPGQEDGSGAAPAPQRDSPDDDAGDAAEDGQDPGGGDDASSEAGGGDARGPGDPADPATWDRLAECESGGDWQADTGNGFYGGLQFALPTWRSVGGTGKPHEHARQRQIELAQRLHDRRGWAPWPHCARELGYR